VIASEIRILSDDDQARVHDAALAVLERRGVLVEEPLLREQLKARGGTDGRNSGEILLPRELVEECLLTAGREPVLYCVSGKALRHRASDRYYASIVTDPWIVDYREGLRKPRLDDIARHARLSDALPLIDNVHLMDDTVPELDSATSELKCLEAFAANTTTSYHCAPGTLRGTRTWLDVAEIMAGGDLKRRPILMAYVPTVSPLTLTEQNVKQLRMFIERGAVCNLGPCAIGGATAPWPLAGLLAQSWAEFLLALVAAQVIQPGVPVLGSGGGAHPMDMATGESLYSGVSKSLASAAVIELCAWLDLPTIVGNYTTLCSNYGMQNGMESALGVFATFFGRCNCFGSMGSIANACGMSAAQIVLHHDLAETLERFRRGIDVTDEKLAVDSIVAAGPRGQFLDDPLTLKYLRSDEHFFPPSMERCAGGADVKTMAERAQERAEDLIASHKPAVPGDRLDEVRRYVATELRLIRGSE